MEAFQLRRSNLSPVSPLHTRSRLCQGNGKGWKHRNSPQLASDSSSHGGDSADDYLFTCELGWRSSKQAVGTPIKNLLAEEMSRESESKRRSPSVIARLMGLDGLPHQQSSHKQPKKSSENYPQRTVLQEKAQQNSTSYGWRSSRRSSKEEQEFKDVFEVLDTSKMDGSSHSSRGNANSNLNEAEMVFIQQKFMDAKRLSTDEKLQNSKEFHDAIEDLDSNKDLLLKYLQQPDSLFTKHLHDLQGASPESYCGRTHISVVKPLHPSHCTSSGVGCNKEREASLKNRRKPHISAVGHSYNKHEARNSVKSSRIQLEQKDESSIVPTRIVVLKPNLGKMQNSTRTASIPHSSHGLHPDSRKHVELPSVNNWEAVSDRRKRFPDDAGPSRYKSRESREIAKEITRQMRKSFSNGSMKIPTSGFRGYAGDESSSNMSEIESANESEETTVASIDWSNRYRPSSSCSTESSVSREARKRLSDRWKLTHKSVDMGLVSRSSTLGEMLAIPDSDARPVNSGDMICKKVFSDKGDHHDRTAGWGEPLGISSRDGWKDVGIRNLSRSRSMPASSTTISSPRTGMRRENVCNERYMTSKQVIHQERNKSTTGNLNRKEYSPSRSSRSRTKKSQLSSCTYRDCIDTTPEIHFGLNQVQSNITEDDPYEQSCNVSETSARFVTETSSVPENVVDVAMENMSMHSKPIVDQESSTHMLGKGVSSASNMEISRSQETLNGPSEQGSTPMQRPIAELGSSASSKEADQPSPISVLETPFPDDLSSGSECFESLNADLHGLRMQLQLLKLESEAYGEGTILISSDEDVEERSVACAEDLGVAREENREFSYVVDILLDSGVNDADPDKFMATWHSPECPVNPLTFEELEKKYHNHISWPRSERRLLFDRINLGISMIYQQFADPHPWVRPATMAGHHWIKKGLENRLHELITNQDKKASKDITAEKMLATDSQWIDLREDVDTIGREIERLLTEELVNELVAV